MDTKKIKEEESGPLASEPNGGSLGPQEHQVVANGKQVRSEPPTSHLDGHILSWGCGEFGQHGHGITDNVSAQDCAMRHFYEQTATRRETTTASSPVAPGKGLKIFVCGASHTVVVTELDEIFTWGNGNSGQLGCGDKKTHLNPQRVRLPAEDKAAPIQGVACGSRHTVLWKENGLCFSWGNNFYAQLGYDFRIENYKDNQAARQFLSQHLASKTICDEVSPHMLHPIAHWKVVQVACGEKHTLFLYDTGVVAACGCSSFGQLGTGNRAELVSPKALESPEGIVSIACGANHSLAVTATGEVYAWGLGRACGHRRQDVLQPVRKLTRRSNAIAAAGGSTHSAVLTANGTVYTWGGGTEGQLGHGSKVLYLSDPRPLSHDALPGAAQITCGDSYTAAVTSDGALFMWGKGSHVIPTPGDANPSTLHPSPVRVSPGGHMVSRVACGSWHAMAMIGTPEWLPLDEESGDDEVDAVNDDSDFSDGEEMESGNQDMLPPETHPDSRSDVFHKQPPEPNIDHNQNQDPMQAYRVRRETTKLTLAEFYAPTPLPTLSPDEECSDEMHSDHEVEVESIEPCTLAVLTPEKTILSVLDSQGEGDAIEDTEGSTIVSELSTKEDSASFFVGISGTPKVEKASEKDHSVVDRPKQAKERLHSKGGQRQGPAREMNMVRSKTMPVVNRKPLKVAPASTTTAFDWSESPKPAAHAKPSGDRFVIHKHVSVQMKGSGSGDKTAGRRPIAQVGLHSSREGDTKLSRAKDKNVMPQPPKFNRAKTYYGRMNQGKMVEAEPRMSQFISSLPAAPLQAASAPAKTQARQRAALERAPGSSSDLSPVRAKPSSDVAPTVSQLRGQLPERLVFSSASSWRSRSKGDDVL